jgi:hypothetical protein
MHIHTEHMLLLAVLDMCIYVHTYMRMQEYESESEGEEHVDAENQYYNSKQLRESNPAQALQSFQKACACSITALMSVPVFEFVIVLCLFSATFQVLSVCARTGA